MRWVLEPVSGPDIEVVTVDEMKGHLGEFASMTSRDAEILSLIKSSTRWAENYTGRALIDQTWCLSVNCPSAAVAANTIYGDTDWARNGIALHRSPALAITSFTTVDTAGDETNVDPDDYALADAASKWPRVAGLNGTSWTSGSFRVTFRAGYADRTGSPVQDASVVPDIFKIAIKLHVEAHYNRDADMEKLVKAAENLLRDERCNLSIA